jgi:hypothetical protein
MGLNQRIDALKKSIHFEKMTLIWIHAKYNLLTSDVLPNNNPNMDRNMYPMLYKEPMTI